MLADHIDLNDVAPRATKDTVAVIRVMKNSSFRFFLTGSRFFRFFSDNSDWDFFVDRNDDNGGLMLWLEENNFFSEVMSPDIDNSSDIVEVWRHKDEPIHIQVVRDAMLKDNVQRALVSRQIPFHMYHGTSKTERRLIWDIAFTAYEAGLRARKVPEPEKLTGAAIA